MHPNAKDDLERIKAVDPASWAKLVATTEAMTHNTDYQDLMTEYGVEWNHFNCKSIKTQQDRNRDIWRLRRFDAAKKYRIIYAYQQAKHGRPAEFLILAIADKDTYDYEPDHPLTDRIVADYEYEFG